MSGPGQGKYKINMSIWLAEKQGSAQKLVRECQKDTETNNLEEVLDGNYNPLSRMENHEFIMT